jgi:hypothetical protein
MLVAWGQPDAVCRLGLFHSAYSNSFVSMSVFNPDSDRGKLRALIGEEAESLVFTFCVIDREEFERMVLSADAIPAEGITMKHIRSGEPLHLSAETCGCFLVHTVADYQEQFFNWQEELEAGRVGALWPGDCRPQCRMGVLARMARIAARDGKLPVVPPIFERCTALLPEADEGAARDAYVDAMQDKEKSAGADAAQALLAESTARNPFVGEPHVMLAQLHVQAGRWAEAQAAACEGCRLLFEWGCCWDKRVAWEGWIAWARCIHFQAARREWPTTSGGVESMGAVAHAQRFRELSVGDNSIKGA